MNLRAKELCYDGELYGRHTQRQTLKSCNTALENSILGVSSRIQCIFLNRHGTIMDLSKGDNDGAGGLYGPYNMSLGLSCSLCR